MIVPRAQSCIAQKQTSPHYTSAWLHTVLQQSVCVCVCHHVAYGFAWPVHITVREFTVDFHHRSTEMPPVFQQTDNKQSYSLCLAFVLHVCVMKCVFLNPHPRETCICITKNMSLHYSV